MPASGNPPTPTPELLRCNAKVIRPIDQRRTAAWGRSGQTSSKSVTTARTHPTAYRIAAVGNRAKSENQPAQYSRTRGPVISNAVTDTMNPQQKPMTDALRFCFP